VTVSDSNASTLTIESSGLIDDARTAEPQRRIAFFPSLCPLADGSILAGFQSGPAKNDATGTIRLARSTDGGRSWAAIPFEFDTTYAGIPGSLGCAEMVEAEPGRLLLFATWWDRSDPARPLFDPVTEGILHSRTLVAVSVDGGSTWSGWKELPTHGLRGCSLTGPILHWHDGTIAVPFESFREFDDPDPRHHAAWLVVSHDGGRTFSEPVLVAEHPDHTVYYWDQRLCTGAQPGSFTGLFWTHDIAAKRDLTVHMRRARLADGATAGAPPTPLPIPGQIAAPLELADGRLLAFVVDRGRPGTMTLWQSGDGGRTWPEAARLVVHVHDERAAISQRGAEIDFAEYWEEMGKWSFGHPVLRLLPDGRLLAAWYAGTPQSMSIHWARISI
jgi:hypothetical protein